LILNEGFPEISKFKASLRLSESGAIYSDIFLKSMKDEIYTAGHSACYPNPLIPLRRNFSNDSESYSQAAYAVLNMLD
jgi:hypothetical protein